VKCSICDSEKVKYKNSKKDFAIGKLLCRKCYNILYKQTEEYKVYKHEYDLKRFSENKERILSNCKVYYLANRDKELERRREHYLSNKGVYLHYSKLRKHKKSNATPIWLTKEHKDQICSLYKEARRLTELTGVQFAIDHIVPINGINVSGLHVPWNLQILTEYDNRTKSNKLVEEIVCSL
jgi:hypothetical protein